MPVHVHVAPTCRLRHMHIQETKYRLHMNAIKLTTGLWNIINTIVIVSKFKT